MSKIRDLLRGKTGLIIAAAAFILLASLAVAALAGVFKTAGTSADAMPGMNTGQGASSAPISNANLVNTAVEISAAESDSLGVSPLSTFKLVFSEETDEKTVASALSVDPAQTFSIEKVSGREFNLKFDKPLQSNSIYSFTLSDKDNGAKKSWAFQTKKQLSVVRTLPRDKATYVPVNSGIEITFSHNGIENAEECFEITPKVNGRFEWNKKTLVFVPENLDYGTIYTVTIKKGLKVKGSSDSLQNDYTFKFQTEYPAESKKYFQFADNFYNFIPGTVPALELYTMREMAGSEIPVEIYRYPDAAGFLNDLKKNRSKPYWAVSVNSAEYDFNALEKAASVNCSIVEQGESYWRRYYLLLPTTLQEGYYLVSADIDGDKYYAPMQINSTSVYIMTSSNKYLAWLNDTVTGKPVSGAVFKYENGASAISDGNGLAVFDAPQDVTDVSDHFFIIEPKSHIPFVACVPNYGSSSSWYGYYYGSDVTDNYWTYMYLDRSVYLPRDTINVWGIIKPRNGADGSNEGVLELICYNWYSPESDGASVLASQNITLSPDGTFTGSLKISNYNPGSYSVRVRIGDKVMLSHYLQITDYTKPVYTIDVVPDRKYMFAWETVNFDITSSFFEGTPASGMKLDYSVMQSYSDAKHGVLTSDSKGKSSLSVNPEKTAVGWRPETLYFTVTNSEAEEQQVRETQHIYVFPRDTMIEVESKTENGKGTITFTTSKIDISGLISKGSGYPAEDDYRGKSVDIPVTAKLYERYYVKVKTGYYYDHINKVRRDTYEYNEAKRLISEYRFTTVNGKYEIQYDSDRDKHYTVEISATDSAGRSINETVYIYNWDSYDPYNTNAYVLSQSGVFKQYKTGETVTAEVRYNKDEPFAGANRRYLFVRMRNGIVDYTVSENAVYNFPFESSFIPNIYVKALCFDGTGIYNAGINHYSYDKTEKKLDIEIKPDKQSYKPGDDVKLSVEVKDRNGKPAAAEVNISVVDEAYFALYGQSVDILGNLYGMSISSGFLSDYLSYEPLADSGPPMAEYGGEGGDDSVRKDFRDTAMFMTVRSGTNGKAEVSFRLPDNLTSWRVTCQAVTSDLQAGNHVIGISSKLPFFVDSIFNRVFITGDSPSILVRANGESLPEGADVDYRVTVISEDGTAKEYTAKGKAKTYCEIGLGSMAKGSYTVRIEGAYGGMKDAMERVFRVADSLLETSVTDIIPLTENVSLATDVKGLTTLTFYNEDSSVLYNELRELYWRWGSRLDQVLARKVAGKMLQNYFNEEMYFEEDFDLKKYQTDDGGLALLTYDSSSPELSAKMCSLAADGIDKAALAGYFYNLLENENTVPEDVIYAYWGLAALKEPVLLDIRSLLDQDGLDMKTRLALGVALAEAGDHQGASQIYKELMASATVTDTYAWIDAGTRDDSIDVTALCTLIAMKTNAPEKMKLFNYIKSNSTSTLLVNMERMIFVTNYVKDASMTTSFTYELDGVKKQIDLKKGSYFRLTLTPEKLASIKFSSITGKILAARSYTAPVSEVMKTAGDIVSIKRTYETAGKKGPATSFDRSDTVKVTLSLEFSENAPDGYYEITDVLPAGFRYTKVYYGDKGVDKNSIWYYPSEVTEQKIVFGFYYNKKYFRKGKDDSIVYYAKAVSPGAYTADSAALRHTDKDIAGFSQAEQITVSK